MRRILLRLAIVLVVTVAAATLAATTTGNLRFVVTNGVSMHPVYYAGDLVAIAPSGAYNVGEVVAYRDRKTGVMVLHRIVGGDRNGWQVKGDNNQSVDADTPTSREVIGTAIAHIPKIGIVLESPIGRVALLVLIALGVFGLTRLMRRVVPSEQGSMGSPSRRGQFARATLLAGDLLLATLLLATIVHPTRTASPAPAPLVLRGRLAYDAEVGDSAAYPTGKIESGDTVFTRVATELHMSVELGSDVSPSQLTGTARLDVELTNGAGWHARLPLAAPTPFSAGSSTLKADLDLAHIRAMERSLATTTGVNTGTIDASIVASGQVRIDDAAPTTFTLTYRFALSELMLTYLGQPPTHTAKGPVLDATQPLAAPTAVRLGSSSGFSSRVRLEILTALILCVGLTLLLVPSGDAERVPSLSLESVARAVWIRLADQNELATLTEHVQPTLVLGEDTWQAVLVNDVVYWTTSVSVPPVIDG